MRSLGAAVLLVALVGACGDDAEPVADAAAPEAGVDAAFEVVAPALPAPPAPAARPVLTPCPSGWREVSDPDWPDLVTCDPWPEGGPQPCDAISAHFPGEPGCARIGTECPADGRPAGLPADAVVHWVDVGAAPDGDGTPEAPFLTIADAVRAARTGEVVALAAGRYEEAVTIDRSVTLWGACAEQTIIDGGDADGPTVLLRTDGGVTLRNLTVQGGDVCVQALRTDQVSSLEQVILRNAVFVGVDLDDADVDMTDVVIRDLGGPWAGAGVWAVDGAHVSLDRVAIERPGIWGLRIDDGSELHATATTVSETLRADPALFPGDGALIGEGAIAVLSESVIHHVHRNGLRIVGAGTEVTLRDSVVQDVALLDGVGDGAYADEGSLLRIERTLIERTHTNAIGIDGAGSVLEVEDVVARDTTAHATQFTAGGFGVICGHGAVGTLARAALVRSEGDGVIVAEAGSVLSATDLLVVGTKIARTEAGTPFGEAAAVYAGASLELRRAELVASQMAGVQADGSLLAEDVVVASGGDGAPDVPRAQGIVVFGGGRAELRRVRLEANRAVGLAVESGAEVTGEDVEVVDTTTAPPEGVDGQGVTVEIWSTLSLTRLRVAGNRTQGVAVAGHSTAALEDLTIEGSLEADCAASGCEAGGIGLQVTGAASASATRVRITGSALAGVQVAAGGVLELHEGEVAANPIGANVQDETFDLARLQDRVRWDNDRNFDSSRLPVPGVAISRGEGSAGGCRGGQDEELAVQVEPIGAPTWEPRGFVQTSIRAPNGLEAPLTELLAPGHLFADGALYWGEAHDPPYDAELGSSMRRARCTSGQTFTVDEFSAPSAWVLLFVLVPTAGASEGTSPDFLLGPILGDEVYPIASTGDLTRDGELFDPDFDGQWAGMEDLGVPFSGFSHQIIMNYSNADAGPPGTDPPGHYVFELELLDDTGNGWRIESAFDVE